MDALDYVFKKAEEKPINIYRPNSSVADMQFPSDYNTPPTFREIPTTGEAALDAAWEKNNASAPHSWS